MALIPYRPEAPVSHKVEYRTDVHKMRDGTERRIALAAAPRETYGLTMALTDAQVRTVKAALFTDPAGPHTIPAFHEEVLVRDGGWTGLYITIALRNADWPAIGQDVLVENQAGQYLATSIDSVWTTGVVQFRSAAFTGLWDAGAMSTQGAAGDCEVSCTGHSEDGSGMIGLSADNPDEDYDTIDYALAVDAFGNLAAYQNGVFVASSSYASGDDFSITRTGTLVQYRKNGVEFYNSLVPSTGTLYVDTALFSANNALYGIQFFDDGDEVDIVWRDVVGVTSYNVRLADTKPSGETYAAGLATMCPIYEGYIEDRSPIARNQHGIDDNYFSFTFRRSTFSESQGTTATVLEYDGLPVMDRRGSNEDLVQEQIVGGLEEADEGAAIEYLTSWTRPDIARMHPFAITTAAERQWFKAFLHAARGRQRPFLMSTGRPDIAMAEAVVGVGSEDLVIDAPPTEGAVDVLTDWDGFTRLAIRYTDGTVDYRTVTASVDNGDGTATLTVAGLSGGTIESTSFLETCRLAEDSVEYEVDLTTRVTLGVIAVADSVTGPYYPETGDDFAIQSALELTNLWLFQETSGAVIDQVSDKDLAVALGSPGFGYQPTGQARKGISYAAGQSHQYIAGLEFGLTSTLIGAVVDFNGVASQTQLFGNFAAGGYAMFYMSDANTVSFRILSSTSQVCHVSIGAPTKDDNKYLLLGRADRTGGTASAICCRLGSTVLSSSGSIAGFTTIPGASFGPGSYGVGGTHIYYAFRAQGAQVENANLSLVSLARSLGFHA